MLGILYLDLRASCNFYYGWWNKVLGHVGRIFCPFWTRTVDLPEVQIMLGLDSWNVAVCRKCEVPTHDYHLGVVNNIAGEPAMGVCCLWLVRIPIDPFEGRHCEDVNVVKTL